ncbi:MAG: hypothetical protein ACK4RK_18215 [Gemmataceae bacterium]
MTPLQPDNLLNGLLHVLIAFDWGGEVDMEWARQLVPAEAKALRRRKRTPSSFEYHPSPLYLPVDNVPLEIAELGTVSATAEVTVFDFAAASVAMGVPFQLTPQALTRLAGSLADTEPFLRAARQAATPLFEKLRPAIQDAAWSPWSEEYFVFQLIPGAPLPTPPELLDQHADWLAGLSSLEAGLLSKEEVNQSVRQRLSYSPDDLFLADWAAAILIDQDCDETLQIIEFANLQLLEYRYLDHRMDNDLTQARRLIERQTTSLYPFWRTHMRPLRVLGQLKVEINDLFERTGNVLKLVGDQYLARVYRTLSARFHLETWERSIERKLDVLQGIYQVLSDQAATARNELLEIIIILLIAFEVVMSFVRH